MGGTDAPEPPGVLPRAPAIAGALRLFGWIAVLFGLGVLLSGIALGLGSLETLAGAGLGLLGRPGGGVAAVAALILYFTVVLWAVATGAMLFAAARAIEQLYELQVKAVEVVQLLWHAPLRERDEQGPVLRVSREDRP